MAFGRTGWDGRVTTRCLLVLSILAAAAAVSQRSVESRVTKLRQPVPGNNRDPGVGLRLERVRPRASFLLASAHSGRAGPDGAKGEEIFRDQVEKHIMIDTTMSWPDMFIKVYSLAYTPYVITSLAVWVFLTIVLAFLYARYKNDPHNLDAVFRNLENETLTSGSWRYGLFECMGDKSLCLLTCFCPAIRWSDTMRMAGMISFSSGVFMFIVLHSLSVWTLGISILFLACIAARRRQNLRELFAIQKSNFCVDYFAYLCCTCCAIVQEARQLELAYAVRHEMCQKIPYLTLRENQHQQGQLSESPSQSRVGQPLSGSGRAPFRGSTGN